MAMPDKGDFDSISPEQAEKLAASFRPSWAPEDKAAEAKPSPAPAAAKPAETLEPESVAPFDASKTIPDAGPDALDANAKPAPQAKLDGNKTLGLGMPVQPVPAPAPALNGNRTAPLGQLSPATKLNGNRTAPLGAPGLAAPSMSPARARPMPNPEATEELQALVMKRSNKGLVFAGVGVVAVIGLIVAVKFAVSSSPETPKVDTAAASKVLIPKANQDIPPPPEATEPSTAPAATTAAAATAAAEPTPPPTPPAETVAAAPPPKKAAPAPPPPRPAAKPVAAARPAPAPRPAAARPAAAPKPAAAPAPKAPPKAPSGGIVRDNPF